MTDILAAIFMLIGSTFVLLAAIGIVRLPDLYIRMHAATKTSTLGAGSLFLSVAIYFGELGIVTRALLVVAFIFLTIPVSAHMIARAAYFTGEPLWEGTVIDELRGAYNPQTHELASREIPQATMTKEDLVEAGVPVLEED